MRVAFAPGSVMDFCQGISWASVRPPKNSSSVGLVCAVLWAQQDKCVRQWALSWGIACCPTILPLQRAYLLFSHSLTTLSCQGILRDSSVFGNNRSCRALQKVWLCPLGVKEGPQVPGKSGPKKVQKHTFCQEVNKISLKLSQGQRWKSRWPMTNCENEFVRMTWE